MNKRGARADDKVLSGETGEFQRYAWIDAVKGLGILLVVIGHMPYRLGEFSHFLKDTIFLFHMPLFFFISGWTFQKERPRAHIAKRAKTILLPYFSFILTVVLLDAFASCILDTYSFTTASGWSETFGKLLIGGALLSTPLSVFWFLTCLFFTGVVYNSLYREEQAPSNVNNLVLLMISLTLALLLSKLATQGVVGEIIRMNPLGLFSVPAAMVFFHIGNVASKGSFGVLTLLLATTPVAFVLKPSEFDMKYVQTGNLSNFFLALAICAAITFILKHSRNWVVMPLTGLGRASLVIMALDVPIIHYSKEYLHQGLFAFFALFLLATIIPLAANTAINRLAITRILFLGARA